MADNEQAPNIDIKPGSGGRLVYDKEQRTIIAEETDEHYWSKAHRLANALRSHLTTIPVNRYDFNHFNELMADLQEWRNEDHEDNKVLHRSYIIEIIEGVKALRKSAPNT